MEDFIIEVAARSAHEANRAWCLAHGDDSQLAWADAPSWQKESAKEGVRGVIRGNTPQQSHETWLEHKAKEGWKYGPTKDPERKEHPCFVPYDELSAAQSLPAGGIDVAPPSGDAVQIGPRWAVAVVAERPAVVDFDERRTSVVEQADVHGIPRRRPVPEGDRALGNSDGRPQRVVLAVVVARDADDGPSRDVAPPLADPADRAHVPDPLVWV